MTTAETNFAPSEEDVSDVANDDVIMAYANSSIAITMAREKLKEYRQIHVPKKDELHNTLLQKLSDSDVKTMRFVNSKGNDMSMSVINRFNVGKLSDDAIFKAIQNSWETDDGGVRLPEGDFRDIANELYKQIQKERSVRKTVVRCVPLNQKTRDAMEAPEELQALASNFVETSEAINEFGKRAREFMKPLREKLTSAQESILTALCESKTNSRRFDMEMPDGEDMLVSVSRRKRRKIASHTRKRKLTAALMREALSNAVETLSGEEEFTIDDAVTKIRQFFNDITTIEDDDDADTVASDTASIMSDYSSTHSLVVRRTPKNVDDTGSEGDDDSDSYDSTDLETSTFTST